MTVSRRTPTLMSAALMVLPGFRLAVKALSEFTGAWASYRSCAFPMTRVLYWRRPRRVYYDVVISNKIWVTYKFVLKLSLSAGCILFEIWIITFQYSRWKILILCRCHLKPNIKLYTFSNRWWYCYFVYKNMKHGSIFYFLIICLITYTFKPLLHWLYDSGFPVCLCVYFVELHPQKRLASWKRGLRITF